MGNAVNKLKLYKHKVSCMISCKLTTHYIKSFKRKKSVPLPIQDRKPRIIVSLTTIPSRIKAVSVVVEIMLRQSLKPDKIVLYLGEEFFQNVELPKELIDLTEKGLEIRYRKDLKPHTKYFYAMQEFRDDIIITVDDDILYPRTLIENLVNSYKKYPKAVSCMRAHKITYESDGSILPYNKWIGRVKGNMRPSHKLLATGVGGVLYPPNCFNKMAFDVDKIKELSFKADDIWLKVMEWINDIPVVKAKYGKGITLIVKDTQEVNLVDDNLNNNRNDIYMNNLLKEYNFSPSKNLVLLERKAYD